MSSSDDSIIDDSSEEAVEATVVEQPRGKELRLVLEQSQSYAADNNAGNPAAADAQDNNDKESDDEPLLAKQKTKSSSTKSPKKKSSPPRKKTSPARSNNNNNNSAKKKKRPLPIESDEDDVVAAVVVEEPVKKKAKKKSNDGGNKSNSAKSKSKEGSSKSQRKATPEQKAASLLARAQLHSTITSLPHTTEEGMMLRSLGNIVTDYPNKDSLYKKDNKEKVRNDVINMKEHSFTDAANLFPVGYSCDRYVFSPIHGRMIRIRCEILDGRLVSKLDANGNGNHDAGSNGETTTNGVEPSLIDENGPIFRIMWGPGIEADTNHENIPYPMDEESDEIPQVGRRCCVRFDVDLYREGTIRKVTVASSGKSSSKRWNISLEYDDGVLENTSYPDPDVRLFSFGYPPIQQSQPNVTTLHSKPVHTVLAKSPLEAWGKALLSFGLIDEIIYEEAMHRVELSREEMLMEAKERIDSVNKKRREDRSKVKHGHATRQSTDGKKEEEKEENGKDEEKDGEDAVMNTEGDEEEPPSEQELELRAKLERLKKELDEAKMESRSASVDLANARISTISPFAANPFLRGPDATTQEQSLVASAVRKEKSKMGNTGNKRKVVTPATMLDRTDTFFTQEIERLIEGLTDSEYAPLYVFHANRSAAMSNQAWAYEAKIRHLNAIQKKLEKEQKAAEEAEAKVQMESERLAKKKAKEEEAASRKRAREEEEDQKKREKVEKRLAQLSTQMDERLTKEAYFANEKAIMSYLKGLSKEFNRRRKVADAVIAHKMDQMHPSSSDSPSTAFPTYTKMLPPLSNRIYDESVVRIWDFLHCFSDAFDADSQNPLPTLDSLQDAIHDLTKGKTDSQKYSAAVAIVERIAMMLCKAISPGLTKYLAASTYQSDPNKGSLDESVCLPVTASTWREVARMSILGDFLIDLGYSKNESANIVKGYRSGGHPNSKEAKRWKKVEDSPVVMLYQQLNDESNEYRRRIVTSRLSAPSKPSCSSSDWRFFLHNIRSKSKNSSSYIKMNVEKSLSVLMNDPKEMAQAAAQTHISELERCLSILKQTPSDHFADPDLLKAKKIALDVLDSTRGKFPATQLNKAASSVHFEEPPRIKMGLIKNYELSSEQYRKLELAKEDYMVAALKLKEELEGKNKDDTAALSDDEEDVEEGNASEDKPKSESQSGAPVADTTEKSTAAEPGSNTGSEVAEQSTEKKPENVTASLPNKASTDNVEQEASYPTAESASDQPSEKPEKDLTRNDEQTQESKPAEKLCDANTPEISSDKPAANPDNSAVEKVDEANVTNEIADPCGVPSDYDFCADVPTAPEPIRRCLAVVRTLCSSQNSDPFIYPVDPQLYPGYYESVITPMSLYDVGNFLRTSAQEPSASSDNDSNNIAHIIANFGRKVRKIFQNSLAYNTGNKEHLTMNSAEEMTRLFERLFFDWVLAPSKPLLKDLDDDKCIDSHDDDVMNMVILCDACEGKYNMSRLKPPLKSVPAGEWYCPRCIQGRCWATEDPRLGRLVQHDSYEGTVESCKFVTPEDGERSIIYCIADDSGSKQFWDMKVVDKSIIGEPVSPIEFLDALAECPGYSFGRDAGILSNTLPLPMDPYVDDKAAQSALSSNVYQDSVLSCISLMHPPDNLDSNEWVRLLMLLVAKCSSSDMVVELASNLENTEASTLASAITTFWRARGAKNIVPDIYSDSDEESIDEEVHQESEHESTKSAVEMQIDRPPLATSKQSPEEDLRLQDSNESSNDGVKLDDETSDRPTISPEEELRKKKRETVLFAKSIRQKKREECLVGYYAQNSLKSTVASFEEDPISSIFSSNICNQEEGLNISSVRCRELCHFCHLSDLAICSPMCRVPNDSEWNEIFPHAVHDRNSYMVAQMPSPASNSNEDQMPLGKVCIVRVRVAGELVTEKVSTLDYPSKIIDQPLQQYLPRNVSGFQHELRFRQESNLSVVTGALTAHEVCAIAAHRTRKEIFLKDRREHCKSTLARDAAISCGKSIPIGQDHSGRTYWLFKAEPKTLFICEMSSEMANSDDNPSAKWHRFSTPEAIASVMVGLGKDPPSESIKEAYPEAAKLVKERMWSTKLMQRALKMSPATDAKPENPIQDKPMETKDAQLEAPFVEDEDVLVESENGSLLWDAVVVDVSKDPSNGKVIGYLVHFKGWSSRFDSWVSRDRVVEANQANLNIQSEVLEEISAKKDETPAALEGMFALRYLQQTNWKNSKYLTAANLNEYVCHRKGASHDEKSLQLLKGTILLLEAALPSGAIEYWPANAALLWSNFVKNAQGPEILLKCVLLLEDAISPDYMKPQAFQLLAALPRQWRAMGEASISSVALRVAVLDHSLIYNAA